MKERMGIWLLMLFSFCLSEISMTAHSSGQRKIIIDTR